MLIAVKAILEGDSSKKWWVWYGLIFYLITIQLVCLSLAGLLFLMLFLGFFTIYLAKRKFGTKGFIGAIIMAPLLVLLVMRFVPGVMTQLEVSKLYATEYLKGPSEFVKSHKTYIGGNETRLIMWTASAQEIAEHPFGVGTGNVDDHLEARLISLGHLEMSKKMYNPHNQYLQTALEIGIPGLVLLLMILITAIFTGLRYKCWLLTLLAFNLGFNCLFESMFQRQSGIVFYTFWLVLFSVLIIQEKRNTLGTNKS
jgi:O-antigen ligase